MGSIRPRSSLLDGLVGYWRMDNEKALWDCHGKWHMDQMSNPATAFPPTRIAGKIGWCLDFPSVSVNGTGFYVADSPELRVGDEAFTVCGWQWLDAKPNIGPIITKLEISGQYSWALIYYSSGDRYNFIVSTNGSGLTLLAGSNSGAISTGQWYFVVAWHDPVANQLGIQVNNGTPNTTNHSSGVFAGTSRLGINEYTTGSPIDGRLDGIGYWKRLLSDQERAILWNGGNGIEYPFL